MAAPRRSTIVYDVGSFAPDASTVDVLARLYVTLRLNGYELFLRGASAELCALIDLCGLAEVLRVEPGGQAEQRE